MKIKTQFIITIILFSVLLVAISTSVIITNIKVERTSQQEDLAGNIARDTSGLGYLATDYLIYRESQQLERWQHSFDSISNEVSMLKLEDPVQEALVNNLKMGMQNMKNVFDSIVLADKNSSQSQENLFNITLFGVSWSRIAVQGQSLVTDASRLAQILSNEVTRLHRLNLAIIIALMVIFVAYFLINYLIIQRHLFKSLQQLQNGIDIIGSGNLDYTFDVNRNDEIGILSNAFNKMAVNLKILTTSKKNLEKEVKERQNAEEALRKSEDSLLQHSKELEASNKELEAFSYSISHDLRAPLRRIDGFSKILMDDYYKKLDKTALEYLDNIRQASAKISNLFDDLQRLYRISTSEFKSGKCNLSIIARSIIQNLKKSQPGRDIEFLIQDDITTNCDENLINIALTNLLENAMKFTGKNKNTVIEFGSKNIDNKKTYYIKDNGIGFDMEYADKLFVPFNRLHSDKEIPGTGIGLTIVDHIIKRHNGIIWAEGNSGEGATFYFTLNV